jgi:hypothetical protein
VLLHEDDDLLGHVARVVDVARGHHVRGPLHDLVLELARLVAIVLGKAVAELVEDDPRLVDPTLQGVEDEGGGQTLREVLVESLLGHVEGPAFLFSQHYRFGRNTLTDFCVSVKYVRKQPIPVLNRHTQKAQLTGNQAS